MSGNMSPAVFEGFALETLGLGKITEVRKIVRAQVGKGWTVRRFGDAKTDFEVTSRSRTLSTAEAWEAAYRLRAVPGVVYAEPVFAVDLRPRPGVLGEPPAVPLAPADALAAEALTADALPVIGCFGGEHVEESRDPEWSLREINAFEAWAAFFPDPNVPPGAGIVIGHPDTGFRRHPEIADNLLAHLGRDFVDGDGDAEDPLTEGPLFQPGHGTSTASVIVSPRRAQAAYPDDPQGKAVSGVAPGAKLIPLRVTPTVILNPLSVFNVAHAIEHATDRGAHVISMSLGGVTFSWRLRRAIRYAQRRGVIVCAAAGNCVGFVTWPAAYDEVIAVAASNARREIWRGSSRGGKVDVTAPGESVWRAKVSRNGGVTQTVERSSGTSYAVATVAGVAALWLARHGRDALVARYGAEKVPLVFNQILRSTCTSVPAWEPGKFGAGLVNAHAALAAPLPDGVLQPTPAPALFAFDEFAGIDKGLFETFEHLFELKLEEGGEGSPARRRLAAQLAALLGTTEAQLPARLREVGQELAFHLTVNPDLYREFAAALAAEAGVETAAIAASAFASPQSMCSHLLAAGVSSALQAQVAH
jgi:serine protease